MKFTVRLFSRQQVAGDTAFLAREIHRHLSFWRQERMTSDFVIKWVGSDLWLVTDSAQLVNLVIDIERGYVAHMMSNGQQGELTTARPTAA